MIEFRRMVQRSTALDYDMLPLVSLANQFGVHTEGPWIGGGAVRRVLLGQADAPDYDFFFAHYQQMNEFVANAERAGYKVNRQTAHHTELVNGGVTIQAIHFAFYPTPKAVLDSFDFTICQTVFDGTHLYVGEHTLWDLGRKRLAVNKITYPVASLRRLIKYANQGFTACGGCLATLVEDIRDITDPQLNITYVD